MCRITCNDRVRCDVFRDHGTRTHDGAVSDCDAWKHDRADSQERASTDADGRRAAYLPLRFPESTLCNPVQTEVVREQEDTVADHATVSERYGPGKAKIKVCLRTHPQRTAVDFDSTSP
ncbi:hypothetical protein SDC9_176179 [bioreactor metagenome]|uniref:Uncharacterized protein n=1 Tax=bioreactor metagenome TaxID=1076179 RepID=A0A645GXI1_9ZZZZ